jgi:hypothetical protein
VHTWFADGRMFLSTEFEFEQKIPSSQPKSEQKGGMDQPFIPIHMILPAMFAQTFLLLPHKAIICHKI